MYSHQCLLNSSLCPFFLFSSAYLYCAFISFGFLFFPVFFVYYLIEMFWLFSFAFFIVFVCYCLVYILSRYFIVAVVIVNVPFFRFIQKIYYQFRLTFIYSYFVVISAFVISNALCDLVHTYISVGILITLHILYFYCLLIYLSIFLPMLASLLTFFVCVFKG